LIQPEKRSKDKKLTGAQVLLHRKLQDRRKYFCLPVAGMEVDPRQMMHFYYIYPKNFTTF